MKLISKVAAAVVATAAISSTNAAILDLNTGDSELMVFLLDSGSRSSFSFDTGVLASAFDPTVNQTIDLAAPGSLFDTWKTTVTGTIQFSVFGGDNVGPIASAGSRSALFTTTAGANPLATMTNQTFGGALGNASAVTYSTHNAQPATFSTGASTHQTQTNGSHYTTATSGAGLATVANYTGAILTPFGISMVNVGDKAEFFRATNTAGNPGIAKVSVTDFYKATETSSNPGGFWTLTNAGLLSYTAAPVPEASEWAMMLAGLGFISLMVRRRSFSA